MKPSAKSRKKAADTAALRKLLRYGLMVSRGPACQYPGCPDPWTDMHEILTRGRGGDPTDEANILCLCRRHHEYVTTHEEEARRMGLVRARTAEEHAATFRPWLEPITKESA